MHHFTFYFTYYAIIPHFLCSPPSQTNQNYTLPKDPHVLGAIGHLDLQLSKTLQTMSYLQS